MTRKKLQCKDIPTLPILQYLAQHGGVGCSWYEGWDNSVFKCMPPGTPEKLVRAKIRQLMHKGLVNGCDCGCRGDWELTCKGEARLGL